MIMIILFISFLIDGYIDILLAFIRVYLIKNYLIFIIFLKYIIKKYLYIIINIFLNDIYFAKLVNLA